MEGGKSTPLKEIRRQEILLSFLRYDKEGFIHIPPLFRKYFGARVRILFDVKENLIALQPSQDETDYPTTRWRIWCTSFFREYEIPSQKVKASWDKNKNYLIAKIKRG